MAAVVFAVAGPGNGRAGGQRWSSPDGSQMPVLGERSMGGMGAEWYFVPAVMPWAGRGVIGQWRRAVSIGEVLATARSQAGLTITQVSQRTRIRETIIRGIERDDFTACGGDFYARGHIRAIAHAVGVDGEPLVGDYDSTHGTPQAQTAAGLPGPPAPLRLRQRHTPNRSVALLLLLVVVVVVAAVAGLVTYHLVASGPAGGAPAAARKPVASVHKTARAHPAAANTRVPPAVRPGSREVVISLTAVTEACWADLATPAGATIFAGILGPGTSKTWTERRAVTLQLGNPGAVTLTVDGKSRAGLGSQPVTLRLAPGNRSPR
jgi:cytoskeletal protein RodZ